jgi:BirA family biotin operon repressor/biotin-[acetyl-CoA-carboxylase] ligase
MKTSDQGVDFVILGIGLNVNIRLDELDPAFRNVATSLCEETGIILSRLRVMEDLVDAIERCYPLFIREGFDLIRRQWLRHCDMVGQPLRVVFKEDIQTGQMLGIDEDGSLLLGDGQNNVRRVMAGDASIMKD